MSNAEAMLARGRVAAEALMVDTFEAFVPGEASRDSDGFDVPGFTSHGTTPGKLQGGSGSTRDPATRYVEVGGVRRPVIEGGLHIPIGSPRPTAGDRGLGWEYQCTAVGAASDPANLGRRFLVVNSPAKSLATARRLDIVEVP